MPSAESQLPSATPAEITALANEVLSSKTNLNLITKLLALAASSELKISFAATSALEQVFLHFLANNDIQVQTPRFGANFIMDEASASGKVSIWLKHRYTAFQSYCLHLLSSSSEPSLRIPALDTLFVFLKQTSKIFRQIVPKDVSTFPTDDYYSIIRALVDTKTYYDAVHKHMLDKYLNVYADLKLEFWNAIHAFKSSVNVDSCHKLLFTII